MTNIKNSFGHGDLKESVRLYTVEKNQMKAVFTLFYNVTHMKNQSSPNDQLLLVLEGECDCTVANNVYRLTPGSWVNIPAEVTYDIFVYRTCAPCRVMQVFSRNPGAAAGIVSCNIFDMPAKDTTVYFGWESADMIGRLRYSDYDCSDDGISVDITHKGKQGKITILHGRDSGYQAWLKEKYGILWDRGVRSFPPSTY